VVRDQRDLLRVTVSEDGSLRLDPRNRRPGRGAYLCPTAECLAQARRRGAYARAFRRGVPDAAIDRFETEFLAHLESQPPAQEADPGEAASL